MGGALVIDKEIFKNIWPVALTLPVRGWNVALLRNKTGSS